METFGTRLRSQLLLLHKLRALNLERKTVSEYKSTIQNRMRKKRVIDYPSPSE